MEVYKVEGRGIRARGPGTSKGPQAERHRLLKAARVVGGPGRAEPGQPETERQCPCRVPECRGRVGRGKAKFPSPHSPGPAEGGGAWSPADDTPARFQTSPGLPVVAAPHVLAPGRLAVTSHLLLSSRQLPAGCRHVPGLFLAGGQRARGPHDRELAFPGVKSGGGGTVTQRATRTSSAEASAGCPVP